MRYTVYSIAVLIAYFVLVWRGVNVLPTSDHSQVPSSVRGSTHGYRSYSSFRGFHGGK